jgi:hypothetical protein
MVQGNVAKLITDGQCAQAVRDRRWLNSVTCPSGASRHVLTRGCDDTEPTCQRSAWIAGYPRCDAWTDTVFGGHHQSLHVWRRCLKGMGWHLDLLYASLWRHVTACCIDRCPSVSPSARPS